jgi:hypothetical protein
MMWGALSQCRPPDDGLEKKAETRSWKLVRYAIQPDNGL